LVAPLPAGVEGHFGPELKRFVLLQHHQGQVTAERITAFLASLGVAISKRQVVRLLTAKSAALIAEAKAVLRAGLASAHWNRDAELARKQLQILAAQHPQHGALKDLQDLLTEQLGREVPIKAQAQVRFIDAIQAGADG
jgi:hypothetical protein